MAKEKKDAKRFASVNKRSVDKIKQKPAFVPYRHKPKMGAVIFRFRRPGEMVEGFLGDPLQYHQAQNTYPLVRTDAGQYQLIEIPGNQHLARTIKRHGLVGHYVRITYEGNLPTSQGHYRKIYHVEKLAHYPNGFLQGYKQCLKNAQTAMQQESSRLSVQTAPGRPSVSATK